MRTTPPNSNLPLPTAETLCPTEYDLDPFNATKHGLLAVGTELDDAEGYHYPE
jgi:hypothetical protein